MSRAIILHGRPDEQEYFDEAEPSASNAHWIPWLQRQLMLAGHDVQTPEVHRPFELKYHEWRREFERNVVDEPMILVGHSTGAGFLVRWLSEHPAVRTKKLALVAPWLDPDGTATTSGFFAFVIDDDLPARTGEFHIFQSSDDMDSIVRSVDILRAHFPASIWHDYDTMGHFTVEDMHTTEFPDLLAALR